MSEDVNIEAIKRLYGLGQNVASITGYTEWSAEEPPCRGWWEVRMVGVTRGSALRRWWNGERWSRPVSPGFNDAAEAMYLSAIPSHYPNETFEWRGINPSYNGVPIG